MEVYKNRALKWLHNALDLGGFFFDGFDFVNVLLYHFEGRDTEASITLLCLIPGMGNFLALPVRLTLKLGDNAGEALIKLGKKYFPDAVETGSRLLKKAGGKVDDVWRWIQKKLGRDGAESGTDIKITFPQGEAQLKHIFRDAEGHLLDTPANRQKILDVTSNVGNYLGKDARGNDWYAIISKDGKQTWVRVRNGVIDNAGVNDVPRIWDSETGLYNNTKK